MNKASCLLLTLLASFSCWATNTHKLSLNKLPVSELHVHAEAGVLTPALVDRLASKHHLDLSSKNFFRDGIIYNPSGSFADFLKIYDKATALIKDPDDLTLVIYDYLKRSAEEGAIYIEFTTSPNHFKQLAYKDVVNAAAKAINKAKNDFGIESRMLIVLLRHEGPKKADVLLDKILAYRHPYVVGLSLAGDDVHYPAKNFAKVYARAQKAGLKLSAHMGEHTGPEDIKLALEMKLDRIGHGISVIKDPELVKQVAAKHIGFEVCPSSNINIDNGPYKTFEQHPFGEMLKNKVFVSVNTDDPAFLQTTLSREYDNVQKSYQLSNKEMIQLCRNAVEMSFAEKALKQKLLRRIDLYESGQALLKTARAKDKKMVKDVNAFLNKPSPKSAHNLKKLASNAATKKKVDVLTRKYRKVVG